MCLTDSSIQPYLIQASKWDRGEMNTSPRDLADIPTDLMTLSERECNYSSMMSDPVWVRTAYGVGTDARFQELMRGSGMNPDMFCGYVADDGQRYNLADEKALFAFFPSLLEAQVPGYTDEDVPDDDSELQDILYMTDCKDTSSEEHRLTCKQQYVFVADDRAFRSGLLEWRMVDEFGNALFRERIQPWSLQDIVALKLYRSPEEFRKDIADGCYGGDPIDGDNVVGPWEPPAQDDAVVIVYDT
jgi:hypothetical protein